MKMKCYKVLSPKRMVLDEDPIPSLGDGEVLLATRKVSTCSTDIQYYNGTISPPAWPFTPGHEYCGQVVESRHRTLKPGDKVCYWGQTEFGGFAEYRRIKPVFPDSQPETFFTRGFCDATGAATIILGKGEEPAEATLVEPIVSVLRALLVHPPRPGARVLVLGAGPCGLIAAQLMKKVFAVQTVAILNKSPERAPLAVQAGADVFYDLTQLALINDAIVQSNGACADYVFDTLGDVNGAPVDSRSLAMQMLRPHGQYVLYGATAVPQHIDTWLLLSKGLELLTGAFDVRAIPMETTACVIRSAWDMMNSGLLDVSMIISKTVDFYDEAGVIEGFELYGAGNRLKTLAMIAPGKLT